MWVLKIDQMNLDWKIDQLPFWYIAVDRFFKRTLSLDRVLKHALRLDRFLFGGVVIIKEHALRSHYHVN